MVWCDDPYHAMLSHPFQIINVGSNLHGNEYVARASTRFPAFSYFDFP